MNGSHRILFAILFLLAVPETPARADLVAHWDFDGNLLDAVGGHAANSAEGRTPRFTAGHPGDAGQALELDGDGDFLEVRAADRLPIAKSPEYSVAFWVRGEPQPGATLWAEAGDDENLEHWSIETTSEGRISLVRRESVDSAPLDHVDSSAVVLDDTWHHVVWADAYGEGALWIDGVRDASRFSYSQGPLSLQTSSAGATLQAEPCCFFAGALDDLRLFDHALTEAEAQALIDPSPECPLEGDTHCEAVDTEPAPSAERPNRVLAVARGVVDDSGDQVRYLFEARRDDGLLVRLPPSPLPDVEFDLSAGTWTVAVTVDDDAACPDLADDASCISAPFDLGCPTEGDTHCGSISAVGPSEGGPGLWLLTALGSSDDSGDDILYTLRGENAEGRSLVLGPQPESTFEVELRGGAWSFTITVDDDTDCDDAADDATCEVRLDTSCPAEGDTRCGDLVLEPGSEGAPVDPTPGVWRLSLPTSSDDSGDLIEYRYRLERDDGSFLLIGPTASNSVPVTLTAGAWTLTASVDDDPNCTDTLDDAVCVEQVEIVDAPEEAISSWPLDASLDDELAAANHGVFDSIGPPEPVFVEDRHGDPQGALLLDGEDWVELEPRQSLPLVAHRRFSLGLWVRGAPQSDGVVWAEASSRDDGTLFSIGPQANAASGRVEIRVRGSGEGSIETRVSESIVFDGEWHHVAWVEDAGQATLWVDGVRDTGRFDFARSYLPADRITLGAQVDREPGRWFLGAVDAVVCASTAWGADRVRELAGVDGAPNFARSDVDGDRRATVTDAIAIFEWLFRGGEVPGCVVAADADDNEVVNLTDGIYVLEYLLRGGTPPPAPGPPPAGCGPDATPGPLDCARPPAC